MKLRNLFTFILLGMCLLVGGLSVQAQSTQAADTKEDEVNVETQLYLIMGTNHNVVDSKLPSSLDGVVKQLRATLPFKNYRLAATLINRSRNEGKLEVSWVGAPLTSTPSAAELMTRSSFRVRHIKLVRGSEGQPMVQMAGFVFSAQIPILTNAAAVAAANPAPPIFNYEGTTLVTDISMREGEPVIVGTLNAGPSGDAVILVVSVKRTAK